MDTVWQGGIFDAKLHRLLDDVGFVGFWEVDFATGEMHATPGVHRLFNVYPAERGRPIRYLDCEAHIHPDDVEWVRRGRSSSAGEGGHAALEFRVVGDNGHVHWVNCRGRYRLADNGGIIEGHGVLFDVSEFKTPRDGLRPPLAEELPSLHRLTDRVVECYALAKTIGEPVLIDKLGETLIALGHMLVREVETI